MSWLDYAAYGNIPANNEHLTNYGSSSISRPVQGQTYRQIRERVTAAWRIRGLTEDTARMLVDTFGSSFQQNAAYPDVGAYLVATGNPTVADSTLDIANFRASPDAAYKIKRGWKLQIRGDDTIYTVTADAALPTDSVAASDSQIKAPPSLYATYGADYDPSADLIFYAAYRSGTQAYDLRKCDGDGSNDASVVTQASTSSTGHYVAVDPDNSHAYYAWKATAGSYATIRRVNYAGTGDTEIYVSGYSSAGGLHIDTSAGYLYIWNGATGVTRCDLDGSNPTTMYTGNLYTMAAIQGNGILVQASSSKTVYHIDASAIVTELFTASISFDKMAYDTTDGGILATDGASADDLYKYTWSGEELYQRIAVLYGSVSHFALVLAPSLNAIIYTHSSGGVRSIGLFTAATTVSITPNLAVTSDNGAEVYFFLTQSCQAQRSGEAAGPYTFTVRAQYDTRWLNGPNTEEVS